MAKHTCAMLNRHAFTEGVVEEYLFLNTCSVQNDFVENMRMSMAGLFFIFLQNFYIM